MKISLTIFGLNPSVLALFVANLLPLGGVIWLGWDTFNLLVLFWLENLVIGLFNIMRMAMAPQGQGQSPANKLFLMGFFAVHYGGFTWAHGVVLFSIFQPPAATLSGFPETVWSQLEQKHLLLPLLALLASHGVSFAFNTVIAGEFKSLSVQKLMGLPYARIMIMHLTVLLGAVLVQWTGESRWALAVLVGIKLALDLKGHRAERRRLSAG